MLNKSLDNADAVDRLENKSPQSGLAALGSKYLGQFIERRDQHAFEELVCLYGRLVFGVCRRVVGSHHDAEDAFQATFLILAQKAPSIKNRRVLTSWLYQVAYQTSLRSKAVLKKRRAKERQMEESCEPTVAESKAWTDLEPLLDQELSRLSEKYRLPVLLCDLGGSTLNEAATELGWSQGTLATRLAKARSILAERLARHGFVLSAATLAVLISQNAASAAAPAALVASTVTSAGALTVGQAIPVGVVSSNVTTFAQGTIKAMLLIKVKMAVAAVVAVSAMTVGLQTQLEKPAEQPKAEVAQPIQLNQLPAEIQRALEANGAQLSPISITYTQVLKSKLSEQETYERLKTPDDPSYRSLFQIEESRFVLQGQNLYSALKMKMGSDADDQNYVPRVVLRELSFDGSTFYFGRIEEGSPSKLQKTPKSIWGGNSYIGSAYLLNGTVGVTYTRTRKPLGVGAQAESFILGSLRDGGELISVSNVSIDEKPHVKVEIRVENMKKTWADQYDVENLKQKSFKGKDRWLNQILEQRKLPKTKRLVFLLDPALNYAVRQMEEWYDPQTLILRSSCSDFQRLKDRQLWLPWKYEIELHTHYDLPGVVFTDSFLTEIVQVTEISGDPVPEEQFVLDYQQPGTKITELIESNTNTKSSDAEPIVYDYIVGNTPEQTKKNREVAARQAVASQRASNSPQAPLIPAKPKAAIHWFLIINLIALLIVGGFFAYRRFRKS